jgi:hypothetical protein
VLGNVDPFELEVSKNKVRLIEKRQQEKEKIHQNETCSEKQSSENLQKKDEVELEIQGGLNLANLFIIIMF